MFTFGIAGVAVLLILAAVLRRQSAALGTALAVAALLGASFLLASRFRNPQKAEEARIEQGEVVAGRMLGRKVAADFPGGGTLLVLRRPPLNRAPDEQSALRLKGLQDGLGKRPFTLVEIGCDPIGLGTDRAGFPIFPEANLAREAIDRCSKDAKIVAVVSLLPWLPPAPEAGAKTAPWYAFDGGPMPQFVLYLTRGIAKVAYVAADMSEAPAASSAKMTDEQTFARMFREMTPDKVRR